MASKELAEELYGDIVALLNDSGLDLRDEEIEAAAEGAAKVIVRRTMPAPIVRTPRRLHLGLYPHEPACPGCRRMEVCNICGEDFGHDRCTSGRCRGCHNAVCGGGSTLPGHGFGTSEEIMARYESLQGSTP